MSYIIAYDLGTGGTKASLHSEEGTLLESSFLPYSTFYPHPRWHEQRPDDWWEGVCKSTSLLLEKSGVPAAEIEGLALSGHSLVALPLDQNGVPLLKQVPIWSDTRAVEQAADFFNTIPYDEWYGCTGNGDPPACYSIMKLMWMKELQPEIFAKTAFILGSKDYINYRLTGNIATDPSYASGSGAFNLKEWRYEPRFMEAAGLSRHIFPDIMPSDGLVGRVSKDAAVMIGLREGTKVFCGGVDNTCMALGARGIGDNRLYTSLGSSCWIALTSTVPVIDHELHPYVFAHAEKGYYTSGMSIFSGGSAYNWVRRQLCRDLPKDDVLRLMDEAAAGVPAGSNGVLFNPSLAGGSAQEKSPYIEGAFLGLNLGSTREDMIRASLEGVAMNLRLLLDGFARYIPLPEDILLCGGGSKSALWRQMFADIYGRRIIKTNIDQSAASLGAAAMAIRGLGLWRDYSRVDALHQIQSIEEPNPSYAEVYNRLLVRFRQATEFLAAFGSAKK